MRYLHLQPAINPSSPISLKLSDRLSDQEQATKELLAAKRIHSH
jgi:hypothetical protein